jgi:DNA-binding NarL/FixJ family response regulator
MNPRSSILIVARPGQLRDSLQVLLNSIFPQGSIRLAEDGLSAIDGKMDDHPALALIAFEPAHLNIRQTLEQFQRVWPQARTIVLVEDEGGHSAALAAGADIVLMKGMRAARLLARIEEFIEDQEDLIERDPDP